MNKDEIFYGVTYSVQFKNLLTKSLKTNSTITQLSNQDVIVRETLIRETIYAWNDELKKFVIKSKKII
jgi:hypothetical protein